MTADYRSPTSHAPLRALLDVIHHAIEQQNVALLDNARTLAEVIDPSLYEKLRIYIVGTRQSLERAAPIQYRTYKEDEIAAAKSLIEKRAYGDFDEAMCDLEYDLRSYDILPPGTHFLSDEYRPELFEDDDDRAIWYDLRKVLKRWGGAYSAEGDEATNDAVAKLRSYQQKSYGALVPTMTGTYIKKSSEGSHGVGVRLAWVDECLRVTTRAPFYEELDDFFIYQSPVESRKMFTRDCFPKNIGGYELSSVSSANLFKYEL